MEYLILSKIYKLLFCMFIFNIIKDINFSNLFSFVFKNKKEERGE